MDQPPEGICNEITLLQLHTLCMCIWSELSFAQPSSTPEQLAQEAYVLTPSATMNMQLMSLMRIAAMLHGAPEVQQKKHCMFSDQLFN